MTFKKIIILLLLCLSAGTARAQFLDSASGLLQMPSGEMQEDGTFMITNNYINQHSLPRSGWRYNTFSYGFGITFWKRVELGYVLTLFWGDWDPYAKTYRQKIIKNQDRHFYGRFQLLRENEFGQGWIPAVVVGISDPTTGGRYNYSDLTSVEGTGNGYFNRMYIAATKNLDTPWGGIAGHLGYQYNFRSDYRLKGVCGALTWEPVWLQHIGPLDNIKLIAEYDSRTLNFGLIASIWQNRFEAMFELQNSRWINFGLRYKVNLLKKKNGSEIEK